VGVAKPDRLAAKEATMADKSPRHTMSKKSGKSLKEKRRDKKAKGSAVNEVEKLTRGLGHHRSH
jgi:hypothetical protein